jgi:hypothetical protein
MKRLFFSFLAAAALARGLPAADPVTISDYDRRAALTLASSLAPGQPLALAAMDDAKVLPFIQEKNATTRVTVYTGQIQSTKPGKIDTGYYRITFNGKLTDAKTWTVLGTDPDTKAELLWKKVDSGTAETWNDIAARRKIGNVILTVALRRPSTESAQDSAKLIVEKYKLLAEQAMKNKLLLRIEQTVMTNDATPVPLAGATPDEIIASAGAKGRSVRVRIRVLDSNDQPFEGVESVTVKLEGPLATYVKIDGADAAGKLKAKPKDGYIDAVLNVAPADSNFKAAQYKAMLEESTNGGLAFKVGVALKGEK